MKTTIIVRGNYRSTEANAMRTIVKHHIDDYMNASPKLKSKIINDAILPEIYERLVIVDKEGNTLPADKLREKIAHCCRDTVRAIKKKANNKNKRNSPKRLFPGFSRPDSLISLLKLFPEPLKTESYAPSMAPRANLIVSAMPSPVPDDEKDLFDALMEDTSSGDIECLPDNILEDSSFFTDALLLDSSEDIEFLTDALLENENSPLFRFDKELEYIEPLAVTVDIANNIDSLTHIFEESPSLFEALINT